MNIKRKKISNGVKYPNFSEEKKLWKKGYKYVIGLDEAGRGPLAGPVVAAAACIKNPNDQISMTNKTINFKSQKRFGHWTLGFRISEIKDSKQLSPIKREKVYKMIVNCSDIEWGIGIISEKVIDKINILEATKLAMKKAIQNLEKKIEKEQVQNSYDREKSVLDRFLILDGNFKIDFKIDGIEISQKSIIKADQKVFSVAAASIIAKVTRDKIMQKYHKKYPQYGFDKHKGYGTKAHFASLQKFGPCKIHRKTFWPVSGV